MKMVAEDDAAHLQPLAMIHSIWSRNCSDDDDKQPNIVITKTIWIMMNEMPLQLYIAQKCVLIWIAEFLSRTHSLTTSFQQSA